MKLKQIIAVCLVLAAASPALSDEVRGTTQAVMIEDAVALDGAMTDPRWAKAPELPLGDCDSTNAARYATWAKLLFSPTHLYVGFHCEEPDTDGMPAKAEQRDGDVWQDDSVEVFLRPDPDRPYYQVVVNARGVFGDSMVRDGRWNGSIEAKTRIVAGKHWRAELKIALADIGCYVGGDQAWRVNFNRTRLGRGADATMECSWAVMGGRQYHAPDHRHGSRGHFQQPRQPLRPRRRANRRLFRWHWGARYRSVVSRGGSRDVHRARQDGARRVAREPADPRSRRPQHRGAR